ncbi:MAG: ABC transporter permease [Anaerolineae bacterium]|nr:ABC transporter permease [Anaerolineae bacterium]
MQPFWTQLLDLTFMQLTNWRWSWRGAVIISTLAPLGSTLGFGIFAADAGPEALGYVLTGNVVLSLLFATVDRVSNHFGYMRMVGRLDFFATLPVQRAALILATVIAFFMLALPSALTTLLVGTALLHVPLVFDPWLIVVVPLIGFSLSGLGALIGLLGRTPEEVGGLGTLISLLLFGFGPVVIPLDRLPAIITNLSLLSPATYAASALRQTLLGWPDRIPLALDLAVLAALAVGLLWLVGQRMDWREA